MRKTLEGGGLAPDDFAKDYHTSCGGRFGQGLVVVVMFWGCGYDRRLIRLMVERLDAPPPRSSSATVLSYQ